MCHIIKFYTAAQLKISLHTCILYVIVHMSCRVAQ